jgi:hypothetical protein
VAGIPRKRFDRNFSKLCSFGENVTLIPLIVGHLNTLHKNFGVYFQTFGVEWNWSRDPAV